jgi:hypothetical protein
MKKIMGYAVAFAAGTLLSGGVAMAAANMVQAQLGNSVYELNGQPVEKAPKLVYGGTTYVQLYSIQQALNKAGIKNSWNGSTNPGVFNMTISTPSTNGNVVGVSKLPYTFTAQDGMKITFNSVSATSQSTVINVTIANAGSETDASSSLMSVSSISDGGPAVNYVDQDQSLYNNGSGLQPGQSVTGNVIYSPLKAGATQFTLYFPDFDFNTHSITFDLSK